MTIEIKSVEIEDVKTLQSISRETFSDTFGSENSKKDLKEYLENAYSIEQLSSEINNKNSEFKFIYLEDNLAGYLKLNVSNAQTENENQEGLEIERIYIKPNFKRLGLGKRLFEYALKKANSSNKKFIWLGVWEKNLPAIAFYEKQGFYFFDSHIFKLGQDLQKDLLMKLDL